MIMTSTNHIVGSIILDQCSGEEWLLSETIADLVQIYTYYSGDNSNEDVSKHLDKIAEERCNWQDAENLRRNLLEVHSNMWYWFKDIVTNVLALLLKFHYQQNTTTGLIFSFTHDMSWRLKI